jgi:hypothetical protein
MTVPPDEGAQGSSGPEGRNAPLDFDPYRFGKPDYPIPPEYAPPGYQPPPAPAPAEPKPVWPPVDLEKHSPGPYPRGPYPYGGYTPHPPPPPGYPSYGAVREGNGKATTAMVLGILGIVFFWLTILDLALAIPAIVLGALALRDSRRYPARGGHGKAMAGLICGIVSVVLVIATVAVVYVRIKPCLRYGISSDRYTSCINDRL